jgi:hypothetical protein
LCIPVYVGFGVYTPVVMKSTIFWDITSYSPLKVNRRFGGKYRLHLQSWLSTSFHAAVLFGLFYPEYGGDMFSETSIDFQQATRRYIPEDSTFQRIYGFITPFEQILRNDGWNVKERIFKLSQCLTNWALCHEGVWWSRCIDPQFLDLGTSWSWVVRFTLLPLHPREGTPSTDWIGG